MDEIETNIGRSIRNTDAEKMYDAACKKVLAEKTILAWLLKCCAKEFQDCDVLDIKDKYIEGTPQIGEVPILPDEKMPVIHGIGTEDTSLTEGTITYDIRFKARAPKSDDFIWLIINVEAQNDYYPGYPLIKRGIYNGSRMISSQYGTEFIKYQYGKIKKVYSIWICMDPPNYRKNTINKYSIQEKNIVGNAKEPQQNFDLMTIMMLCLGDMKEEVGDDILRLLGVLLSNEANEIEKKQILSTEFDIEMTEKMEEGVSQMCNLSQGILRKGRLEGKAEGKVEEKVQVALKAIAKGYNDETIYELTELSYEEIMELRKTTSILE